VVRVKQATIRLSDGRELYLFHSGDDAPREVVDARPATGRPGQGELRFDPLQGEWVTIAGHRQHRTHLPDEANCPLCPSRDGRMTEIPAMEYEVAVFENRFPSYVGAPSEAHFTSVTGELFRARAATGRCEVVCFTDDHNASFADLAPSRVRMIVDVWAERTSELAHLSGVEQVFCFENHGEDIGVTLDHAHGQIYAYPFVASQLDRMLDNARQYRERTGRSLFDQVLSDEIRDQRVVSQNTHWLAFVPAAARWPYEVHLYPRRRVPDLPALDSEQRDSFVPIYLDLLCRFRRLFQRETPYISAWYQAPVRRDRDLMHLHLKLFTIRRAENKLKYLASSESAMGAFSNDIAPERAARRLRDVL
jgi:UDPglucose--hexose-1-phosphate uridylyltransferase